MKLPGWCETCHRVRQVNVTSTGMARLARGGMAVGECDGCREEREERRRGQR